MKYHLIYSKKMLDYIKNTTIEEMENVRQTTKLCNVNTDTIDLYIRIKKDMLGVQTNG